MTQNDKKVIISNQVFFAFIDRSHQNHGQAVAFFRYFTEEQFELYTVLFSVAATYQDLQDHIGLSIARNWLKSIFLGNIQIAYPDEATIKAAIKLITSTYNYNITIDQAVMNVVADKKGIPFIATFEFFPFFFGIKPFTLPL